MHNESGFKQPALGVIGLLVTIGLSLVISTAFDPGTFCTWVGFLVMSMIPTQIVIGLVWQNNYPPLLGRLPQPARGAAILVLLALAVGVIAPLTLRFVGGSVTPPTPFLIMYIILTVVAAFWLVAVFQCWPAALSGHPAVVGLGTLLLAYLAAWAVFRAGFDFRAMAGAPFYVAALDPQGAFGAWNILAYLVTTVAVIMALVLLDFWPLALLPAKRPVLGRQPWFGLYVATFVLLAAGGAWYVGVRVAGMDVVDYMVRVPVCFLFGNFILLTLFQAGPSKRLAQPWKGVALIGASVALAVLAYALYRFAAVLAFGDLPAGPPTYALELWIATAMLSITFPTIVAYGEGFAFWPFAGGVRATTLVAAEQAR